MAGGRAMACARGVCVCVCVSIKRRVWRQSSNVWGKIGVGRAKEGRRNPTGCLVCRAGGGGVGGGGGVVEGCRRL